MKVFKYLTSFINGKLVEKINSPMNGNIYIYYVNGKYILNSQNGNYSFGDLHTAFCSVFKKIGIKDIGIKSVLLLGLGGGSVVELLNNRFKINCPVDAVDFDPVIIDIAEKYFNILKFKNLNIINDDAYNYLKSNNKKYDLVVFDIYTDNEIPEGFDSEDFYKILLNSISDDGILVFNRDNNSPKMSEKFTLTEQTFAKVFRKFDKFSFRKNNYFFVFHKSSYNNK